MVLKARMILPIGKSRLWHRNAFTLIEMLLVLIILSVMLTMSFALLGPNPKRELGFHARQMIIDFKRAQSEAIRSAQSVEVVLSSQEYAVYVNGTQKPLIKRTLPLRTSIQSQPDHIVFYTDGSSTPVMIEMRNKTASLRVSNWRYRFGWVIDEEVANDQK